MSSGPDRAEGLLRLVDDRSFTGYAASVMKTLRHKGLEAFFGAGSRAAIPPRQAGKLRVMQEAIEHAQGHNPALPCGPDGRDFP